jgi:hypothetical protein
MNHNKKVKNRDLSTATDEELSPGEMKDAHHKKTEEMFKCSGLKEIIEITLF